MLYHIIIAMIVLSLVLYGLQMTPLPEMPKRLAMGATVLLTALVLAQRAGVLR